MPGCTLADEPGSLAAILHAAHVNSVVLYMHIHTTWYQMKEGLLFLPALSAAYNT